MIVANKNFKKKVASIILTAVVASSVSIGVSNYIHNKDLQEKDIQIQELKEQMNSQSSEIQKRNEEYETKTRELEVLNQQNEKLKNELEHTREEVSRGARNLDVIVTAYDLSKQSCGKFVGEHGYGITATGKNLQGHSVWSAKAIAVDPNFIPLGSKVQISFNNPRFKKYNGIYTAVDTGSAIKGNKIDLFMGENSNREALNFGVQNAQIRLL